MDIPPDVISQLVKPASSKLNVISKDDVVSHCYSIGPYLPRQALIRGYWHKICVAVCKWDRNNFLLTPALLKELDRTLAAEDWHGFVSGINSLLFFNQIWEDNYANQPDAFFDPMDRSFVCRLRRGLRQVEAGQEALEIVKAHNIPVTVYRVPLALRSHVDKDGHYAFQLPAIDLFVRESYRGDRYPLSRAKSVFTHEQRHASQFMDPVLYAMMKEIEQKTFLAFLLITKIVEADAKAYQRRYEQQALRAKNYPHLR